MKPNKETELIAAVRTTNSNIDTLNFLCFKAIGCGWYSIGEVADLDEAGESVPFDELVDQFFVILKDLLEREKGSSEVPSFGVVQFFHRFERTRSTRGA